MIGAKDRLIRKLDIKAGGARRAAKPRRSLVLSKEYQDLVWETAQELRIRPIIIDLELKDAEDHVI